MLLLTNTCLFMCLIYNRIILTLPLPSPDNDPHINPKAALSAGKLKGERGGRRRERGWNSRKWRVVRRGLWDRLYKRLEEDLLPTAFKLLVGFISSCSVDEGFSATTGLYSVSPLCLLGKSSQGIPFVTISEQKLVCREGIQGFLVVWFFGTSKLCD